MAASLAPAQAQAIAATLQNARGLFPDNAMLTTDLAFVYARMDRWAEALALAELATRQKSDSAQYWLNLASMYLTTGKAGPAQEACARALRLKPDFEEARSLRVRIENAMKAGNAPKTPAKGG
jgi:predicted Zn-dependent protease